jgi:hypothetical protein
LKYWKSALKQSTILLAEAKLKKCAEMRLAFDGTDNSRS